MIGGIAAAICIGQGSQAQVVSRFPSTIQPTRGAATPAAAPPVRGAAAPAAILIGPSAATQPPQRPTTLNVGVLPQASAPVRDNGIPPPDQQALLARMGPAARGAAPPGLKGVIAAVYADKLNPPGFRCASADRSQDSVKLIDSSGYYLVTFICAGGAASNQPIRSGGARTVMLAYHLGPRGAFAPGSGPRRLLPTDGITIGAKSRALIEAENCLNQFQAYRTSALSATFQIKVVSGYARCSTAIQYLPLTLVATPTLPLFTMVETPIQRFGPYSHDVNPNTNNEEYWFDPVLWKHDWQIATMAAVTSGPPSFNRIYFQAYRANMTNPLTRSCKDWNAIGNAGEVHADVQAHPASAGEITGLGLQGIANPYVFSFQIPEASMTTMQTMAQGAASLRFRLAPAHRTGATETCAGSTTASMELNFGTSPAETANAAVGDNVQAAVAQTQAKALAVQKAQAAQNAFFGGQNPATRAPVTVSLAGWIPPFGAVNDTSRGVSKFVTHFKDVNITQTTMKGTDWPEEYQSHWENDCVFDPYFFIQAAQHAANPNSPWDWIKLTITAWSMEYQAMQNLVVEGIGYAFSGGACSFNTPNDVPADSGACKAFKTTLSTSLRLAMTAVGVPPTLPTANKVIQDGAMYLASVAIGSGLDAATAAGAGDVVSNMPDFARQAATEALAKKLQAAAGQSECAYPVAPGQSAQDAGVDAIDPISGCGIVKNNPMSWTKFDPWSLGHPGSAIAWVKVMPNPNGIAISPFVKISVRSDYTDPPKGAVPAVLGALPTQGFYPFINPPAITIDARTLPAEGLYVPVSLDYDKADWQFAVQKTNICGHNAFELQCTEDNAWSAWHSMNWARNGKVTVTVSYVWTQDTVSYSASVPIKNSKGQTVEIWASADAGNQLTAAADQAGGLLGHTLPGRIYGIPKLAACPGFLFNPPDPNTGIQDGSEVPAFDMDSL